MASLSTLDDVWSLLLAEPPVVGIEELPLEQALGRILAQPLSAGMDVPPQDNSAMDGYALRVADVQAGGVLPVSQRIPAGAAPTPLQPGTAARIFTGGIIPAGADTVVMQERVEVLANGSIRLLEVPPVGQHVRAQGCDISIGREVIAGGERLRAAELALAASLGVPRLFVYRPLRVVTLSTGDELRPPGEPLAPGQIYNSSRPMLAALLAGLPAQHVAALHVADSAQATRDALQNAAAQADLVISTGGVSVGEEDHVKDAVQALGELRLWSLAIKPGKPLAWGRLHRADGTSAAFVGLPGNPVSSFVTFLMVLRPYLLRLCGASRLQPRSLSVPAAFDWLKPDSRREFLRVRLDAQGHAELYPDQRSAIMTSCSWADGLIDNPPGQVIRQGDLLRFIPYSELV